MIAVPLLLLAGCQTGARSETAARTAPPDAPPAALAVPEARATQAPPDSASPDLAAAHRVLREYYDAIEQRDFDRAYALWADSGRASGQTAEEFARGYAETRSVQLTITSAGRIEGAAGSRYADVPVVVQAVTEDGSRQRFEGSYVLRRSVVDGATAAQRAWHIYSGDLRLVP